MARIYNMHEAKTQLSRLVQLVLAGEEVLIGRAGEPVVKLVPCVPLGARQPGSARGRIVVDPSFDEPLPDDVMAEWLRPLS